MSVVLAGCTSEQLQEETDATPLLEVTDATPPRYKLRPGQEIHYVGKSSSTRGDTTTESASEYRLWVVRKNEDGSWRVIVQHASVRGATEVNFADADVTLAYVDLFPDGRFAENSSFGYQLNPHYLLARLPGDEKELRDGWQCVAEDTTYSHVTKQSSSASPTFVLDRTEDSPMNRVYEVKREATVTFDREQGLVTRVESKADSSWRSSFSTTTDVKLHSVAERDANWIETLSRELEKYLEVSEKYDALTDNLSRAGDNVANQLDEAAALWQSLRGEVTSDVVRDMIDKKIANHEGGRDYMLEDSQRTAAAVGKSAPDWEGPDLAGKPHRLDDYAGKVVVLDFWYRGCGWCIRAMPQINQLVDDFAPEQVAVLGMNTDTKLDDAKFVESALKLKYPSIQIDKELPAKYGISGFPTLVIIDQAGTVRDLHVGYSRTLREKVAASIRELLANPPAASPTKHEVAPPVPAEASHAPRLNLVAALRQSS